MKGWHVTEFQESVNGEINNLGLTCSYIPVGLDNQFILTKGADHVQRVNSHLELEVERL